MLLGLVSGSAQASVVQGLDLTGLTASADLVVHGQVASARSEWNTEHDRIFTTVTVSVVSTLKGESADRERSFWQWGGAVDGISMWIVGTPSFREDEEIVLFLRKSAIRVWDVVGLAQGKLTVERDARTREKVVRQDTTGLDFARRRASGAEARSIDGMPLAELLREIEAGNRRSNPSGTVRP